MSRSLTNSLIIGAKKWLTACSVIFFLSAALTAGEHALRSEPDPDMKLTVTAGNSTEILADMPRLTHALRVNVTGVVTDAATGEPLPGVNIAVKGTTTGTTTNADGRYEITVDDDQGVLVFSFIGYERQEITVAGRDAIDVALRLSTSSLDELLVTGVGIATERRQLGNTVGSVKSSDLENVAISSPTDMLSGRVSSLMATPAGGEGGEGAAIRLRGSSSLSVQNEPMIYVDGVRMSNLDGGGGFGTSRLNDINPNDIERIEVLKGAAAATLYGSQANSGIIQIFTKSGQSGKPRFTFTSTQTAGRTPDTFPGSYIYNNTTNEIDYMNPVHETLDVIYKQNYSLSVRGGSETVTYSGSAFMDHARDALPDSKTGRTGARLNLKLIPENSIFTSRVGLSYTNTIRRSHPGYGSPAGYQSNIILAHPGRVAPDRPYGEQFTPLSDIKTIASDSEVDNLFVSGQITANWFQGLNSKLDLGYNSIFTTNLSDYPVGNRNIPEGLRGITNRQNDIKTIDFNTSWAHDFSANFSSTFLVGAQAYFSNNAFVTNEVRDLAGPTIRVLRGAATITNVDEYKEEVKNAGAFIQEQIGLWDQLFLTGGLRFDASSAFGSEIKTQTYPKISFSYAPVTDFPVVSTIRLRGSYGESGQQPGAFDAQRTYQPTSFMDGKGGFTPNNLGNPDLKPERAKAVEVGLDAGLFHDRVNIELTYFNQHTYDALVPKRFAPSQGFLNSQLVNVGEVYSKGFEFSINARVLEGPQKNGSVTLTLATLDNKVADMGGSAPIKVGGSQRAINTIQEGYQPGVMMGFAVDKNSPYTLSVPLANFNDRSQVTANTIKDSNGESKSVFLGNVMPTLSGSLFFDFSFGRFTATATVTGAYGATMWDETNLLRNQLGPLTEEVAVLQKELKTGSPSDDRKKEIAREFAYLDYTVAGNWVKDADYIRLQDLAFGYKVPVDRMGINAIDNLSLELSFKNLVTITNYDGYGSPGTSTTDITSAFTRNADYLGLPLPRMVQLGLKIDF